MECFVNLGMNETRGFGGVRDCWPFVLTVWGVRASSGVCAKTPEGGQIIVSVRAPPPPRPHPFPPFSRCVCGLIMVVVLLVSRSASTLLSEPRSALSWIQPSLLPFCFLGLHLVFLSSLHPTGKFGVYQTQLHAKRSGRALLPPCNRVEFVRAPEPGGDQRVHKGL